MQRPFGSHHNPSASGPRWPSVAIMRRTSRSPSAIWNGRRGRNKPAMPHIRPSPFYAVGSQRAPRRTRLAVSLGLNIHKCRLYNATDVRVIGIEHLIHWSNLEYAPGLHQRRFVTDGLNEMLGMAR